MPDQLCAALADGLYQVRARWCVAGLVVRDGRVVESAPILAAWAMGRTIVEVFVEAERRGVELQIVEADRCGG